MPSEIFLSYPRLSNHPSESLVSWCIQSWSRVCDLKKENKPITCQFPGTTFPNEYWSCSLTEYTELTEDWKESTKIMLERIQSTWELLYSRTNILIFTEADPEFFPSGVQPKLRPFTSFYHSYKGGYFDDWFTSRQEFFIPCDVTSGWRCSTKNVDLYLIFWQFFTFILRTLVEYPCCHKEGRVFACLVDFSDEAFDIVKHEGIKRKCLQVGLSSTML